MSKYTDYQKHADASILLYERYTALFVRFCRRCNINMNRVVDAFIEHCIPRVEIVQYNGMPREVINYPGRVAFGRAVESLDLMEHVWNHIADGLPEYEEWYHYETVVFEKLVEKRKIEVKHSDRVAMQRDSINFVKVLKELED